MFCIVLSLIYGIGLSLLSRRFISAFFSLRRLGFGMGQPGATGLDRETTTCKNAHRHSREREQKKSYKEFH